MIEIDRLPIGEITEVHLQSLVTGKAAEGRTLEFKQDIKIGSDGDKKEFCTDVASFVNAAGGLMLHGIRAGKDADQGVAVEIIGIETTNVESLVLQAEQVLYNGISPRLMVGVRAIPLANGKVVIAIKTQRSSIAPHAVGRDGRYSFFTRGSNGKLPMDIPQVRSSFMLSEGLRERLRSYRAERLGRIIANDGIVPLNSGHKLILQVVPLASLAEPQDYDVSQFLDHRNQELCAMGTRSPNRREFNLDGLADVYRVHDESARGYMQVNQNGIIEAVDAGVVFSRTYTDERYQNSIGGVITVSQLIRGLENSLALLRRLGCETPIYAMVTMTGMRNLKMWHQNYAAMARACDRDEIFFQEVVITEITEKAVDLLRPTFDALWRAFGCDKCYYYGGDGIFRYPD